MPRAWKSTRRRCGDGWPAAFPTPATVPLWPHSSGQRRRTCGRRPAARSRTGRGQKNSSRVFPHRWAIPRDTWARFFSSAEHEIDILAYSALFLAEDAGLLAILTGKAGTGIPVRIALGDPDSPQVADRGTEEGIGGAMPAKVRNALALFRPLTAVPGVELRLHRAILYNSIYRADDQLLVNQHTYGIPAAHAPVFHIMRTPGGEMAEAYLTSLERVWATGQPHPAACQAPRAD